MERWTGLARRAGRVATVMLGVAGAGAVSGGSLAVLLVGWIPLIGRWDVGVIPSLAAVWGATKLGAALGAIGHVHIGFLHFRDVELGRLFSRPMLGATALGALGGLAGPDLACMAAVLGFGCAAVFLQPAVPHPARTSVAVGREGSAD